MTNDLIANIRRMQKELGLAASTRTELNKAGELQIVHDRLVAAVESNKQTVAILEAVAEPAATDEKEIAKMLIRLNEYRVQIQKKPLTKWTATRDELAAAITEAKRIHSEGIKSTATKPAPKLVKKPIIAAIVTTAAKRSLAAIVARELGMNPKIARAKLRAKFGTDWKAMSIKEIRVALKS